MIQYFKNEHGTLYQGDALDVGSVVEPNSVHCCVCSPPYWGLRSYFNSDDTQLGLEKTPWIYVEKIVSIFREIKKVMHPTGTLWLVIDDTYCVPSTKREGKLGMKPGVPMKNMIGIPWMVALALQKDDWTLRCDIIWDAPNKKPEPMKDRPTRSHEYVFLLTKKSHYFYDQIAIYEEIKHSNIFAGDRSKIKIESGEMFDGGYDRKNILEGKNRRAVWSINTEPNSDPHYAAFPSKLAARCIKAGTSLKGCCSKCGNPIVRVMDDVPIAGTNSTMSTTVDWKPTCKCNAEVVPCTVLDPFTGRGTTAMAAENLGRKWIGIEITPESVELAKQNLLTRKLGLRPLKDVEDGLFQKDEMDIAIQ